MTYRHHAFISYAWADNEKFTEGEPGWVDTFRDRLGKFLRQELSRSLRGDDIWIDYEQMRGNQDISDTIRSELEDSRLFIPVISKSWLDSPWCQQELEIFLGRHGADSGCIFPVWMSPELNPDQVLPDVLERLRKYPFWYLDENNQPRTRWFPVPDPTDREYSRSQQDMARDMAGRLIELVRQERPEVELDTDSVPPAPVRPNGNHLVLVNGGEDDQALIREVAECLQRSHGIGYMLPLAPGKGLKSSDINRDLRDKLKLCTAMLVVYKDGPEHQVNRRVVEFLKAEKQRPKDSAPPGLDLCEALTVEPPLGIRPSHMRVHQCGSTCAADCARQLAKALP